jgi:homocysteine S-methyltransferase
MGSGFLDRLRGGEVFVLDGAVGTELQRRGVPMDTEAWCAVANLSHPETVVETHRAYIAAGARVVTANTFASARHVLEAAGLGEETEAANRAAIRHAREAVEAEGHPGVLIAGSLSSMAPLGEWHAAPTNASAAAAYREQAEVLADAGAELLVAEMMLDLENAALVVEAALETGLPLLVGWSASPDGAGGVATFRSGMIRESALADFDALMRAGVALGGDVHGIMHSAIEVTGPALKILARHWRGPTMAYAETGRFDPPNWVFPADGTPTTYADTAVRWVEEDGVQIVGGCCGTTPAHIAALAAALGEEHRHGA